jgi:hypothetical protein
VPSRGEEVEIAAAVLVDPELDELPRLEVGERRQWKVGRKGRRSRRRDLRIDKIVAADPFLVTCAERIPVALAPNAACPLIRRCRRWER